MHNSEKLKDRSITTDLEALTESLPEACLSVCTLSILHSCVHPTRRNFNVILIPVSSHTCLDSNKNTIGTASNWIALSTFFLYGFGYKGLFFVWKRQMRDKASPSKLN